MMDKETDNLFEEVSNNIDKYLEDLRSAGLLEGEKLKNGEMGYRPSLKSISMLGSAIVNIHKDFPSLSIKEVWDRAVVLLIVKTFQPILAEETTIYANLFISVWDLMLEHKGITFEEWLKKLSEAFEHLSDEDIEQAKKDFFKFYLH